MNEIENNKLGDHLSNINAETLSICQSILNNPDVHGQHVVAMAKDTIDQLTNEKYQD